ncbi:hypothetical protein RXV86_10540 [Alisedimentitalea sp. MJ-SS2]|nr:hypothetical protein [Alisedimentitalea sp. MJ-SS2]
MSAKLDLGLGLGHGAQVRHRWHKEDKRIDRQEGRHGEIDLHPIGTFTIAEPQDQMANHLDRQPRLDQDIATRSL